VVPAKCEKMLVQQVAATDVASPVTFSATTEDQSPSAPCMSRDLSRERKDQEVKDKLGTDSPKKAKHAQALVREFVRGMLQGHVVTLLTYTGAVEEGKVSRAEGIMKLDNAIQTVMLTCKDGNIVCPLNKIQDIYHEEGDGKEVFPQIVVENLAEGELGRLLMVFYNLEDGSPKAFLMLEETAESRSQFHRCIKILSAHASREKSKLGEKESQPSPVRLQND